MQPGTAVSELSDVTYRSKELAERFARPERFAAR
jgi:hypothetical protein